MIVLIRNLEKKVVNNEKKIKLTKTQQKKGTKTECNYLIIKNIENNYILFKYENTFVGFYSLFFEYFVKKTNAASKS